MAWEEPRKTGMVYRRLGNSGLHVSALSLGGWITFGGQVGEDATMACMKQAYDLGVNFFDTAENYAGGKAEIAMGRAIKALGWSRSDLVISTKINYGGANGNGEILINNHGLSRKHIVEGLRASLRRLDLEYVDIVYAHRPDRLTPMEETVRAFNHVIDRGWALYWGTSEWAPDEIAEACGIAQRLGLVIPCVEQPCYNLLTRKRVEGEYQRLYDRFGLGLTTYSPLKYGMLSGKYNDSPDAPPEGTRLAMGQDKWVDHMRNDRYGDALWRAEIEKVRELKTVSDKLGISLSVMCLAWCLKNPNVSSVIMGASRPEQIVENVKALKAMDKLTPEVMEELDGIVGSVKPDPARQD